MLEIFNTECCKSYNYNN